MTNTRFIVMLRDPVDRAFSHYKHMVALGIESRSFEEAINLEEGRIGPDLDLAVVNPYHNLVSALRFSYVKRGLYVEQLERWYELFPSQRFLILDFRDFITNPDLALADICAFLEVKSWSPKRFPNYSVRREEPAKKKPTDMPEHLKISLQARFADGNSELEAMTGRTFSWL